MNRFFCLLYVLLLLGPNHAAAAAAPMNILVLYADDWRYDTLGVAGDPVVKTPNLDRLAGRACASRIPASPRPFAASAGPRFSPANGCRAMANPCLPDVQDAMGGNLSRVAARPGY